MTWTNIQPVLVALALMSAFLIVACWWPGGRSTAVSLICFAAVLIALKGNTR